MRARKEEGQAVPLVLAVLVLVVLLGVGLARVGRTAVDAAAARTAADAAALAGARGDDDEARAVAAANGGVLVSLTRAGDDTVATVRVGGRSATARARADPVEPPPEGGPVELARVRGFTVHARIAVQFAALLDAAEADGIVLTGGAYRSNDAQIALRRAHCGPSHYDIWEKPSSQCSPPTARPGHSMHEQGLAVDFSYQGRVIGSRSSPAYRWLAAHARSYGLFNLPAEPWHWSVNGR